MFISLLMATTFMNKNTEKLIALMNAHQLSCRDVGKMLGRTVSTVRVWRCANPESPTIPNGQLELLELKLAQQASQ